MRMQADQRRELLQESRERMLAKGWDLSYEAIERAEDLMCDGHPMDGNEAKRLAMFLDAAVGLSQGRHRA